MKALLTLAATAAVIGAVPATAATVFDAFTSFNGTQGAGNFFYGAADDVFANPTFFATNTNCFIAGSICLQAAPNNDVPGVTKSAATSFQYGSVNVPNDRLLVHPGPNANDSNVFIAFLAPTSRTYQINALFSLQDTNPTGVNTYLLKSDGQLLTAFNGTQLMGAGAAISYGDTIYLNQGDFLAAVVNRDGSYGSDSTGVNFTLTAVPEPASWALLIAGFGLTGAAMRRRRSAAITA